MNKTLWRLGLLELAYWIPARLLNHYYHGSDLSEELIWTAFRIISIVLVYRCLKDVIWPPGDKPAVRIGFLALIASVAVVIVAALKADYDLKFPDNVVFAVTSIAVGLREEMVYRGVLQKVLAARYGLAAALIISNVLFIFYHFGALPFTPYNVVQFFVMGTILGLLYHQTRSLLFVAGVHAAYDGIECFSPYLSKPISSAVALSALATVMLVLALKTATARPKTA